MKIFNWVNRRFLHNVHSSVSLHPENEFWEKTEPETVTSEAETKALLKNAALVGALDGWKDGILTIGTFGLDPLTPFIKHIERITPSPNNKEEESNAGEEKGQTEEEEYSLVNINQGVQSGSLPITSCKSDISIGSKFDDKSGDLIMTVKNVEDVYDVDEDEDEISLMTTPLVGSSTPITPDWDKNGKRMMKKNGDQRTTLADLFLADSGSGSDSDSIMITMKKTDQVLKKVAASDPPKKGGGVVTKHNYNCGGGLSFAKKLIPCRVKDDNARPIRKLHRMMKKMLKRKIHPELEARVDEPFGEELKPCIPAANDGVTLLQAPDATV